MLLEALLIVVSGCRRSGSYCVGHHLINSGSSYRLTVASAVAGFGMDVPAIVLCIFVLEYPGRHL